MRVLMVTWESTPNSASAISAHVDGLARGLTRAGHEVVVLSQRTGREPADEVTDAGRVRRVDAAMPWISENRVAAVASGNHAYVTAGTDLGGWRPDVVHAHDWTTAWCADVLGRVHGAPVVTTLHGTERSRHGGQLPPTGHDDVNNVEWWLAFRSSRIIATTRPVAKDIVEGFEVEPERLALIRPGIDPTWWREQRPAVRPESARVLAWGRVQYEKGFQVLARSIAALRPRIEGLECTIAGRGSYLPELQSLIDLAGAGDLIEIPGYLPDDELRAAIHHAAVVVVPSLYEPFGVVALEALAAGAPLIVTDTGGLIELVGDSGAALVVEPGNAEHLAAAIESVLTDRALADRLVTRAERLLTERYSWDAIAARVTDIYGDAGLRR